jgi:hypothetical protein
MGALAKILAFFQPFLDEVVTRVKAAHPSISGGIGLHVESGGTRFQISAGFVYDPAAPSPDPAGAVRPGGD